MEIRPLYGQRRGDRVMTQIAVFSSDDARRYVNNIPAVVVRADEKWWIVADAAEMEELLPPRGPYDTPEHALTVLKLIGKEA